MQNIDYQNINKHIYYSHMKIKTPNVNFHLHEGFEIYFLISGDVNYFVEKKIYPLEYGDLIITNSREIHKPAFQSDKMYERIIIEFNPSIIQFFNSNKFDLLDCFVNRPSGEQNKIKMNSRQIHEISELFYRIEQLTDSTYEGYEILKLNYFIELLVYINRLFKKIPQNKEKTNIPEKLIPVLDYIEYNLENDLSLDSLESKFYINRFYLSKLFKKSIGSSIHNYILLKRISKAKTMLSEDFNVTDTCTKCGFNDYSNFLKMFKRTVGVSPGKYNETKDGPPPHLYR
jgi:YesN/AraC family two-component response regulator